MADGRVLIADGHPLDPSPSWTRFDEITNCRCSGFDITNGRQSEFDKTDAGEATVYFHDRARVIDDPELVGCAIQLQVRDPTTGIWEPQFRGVIDEPNYDLNPNAVVSNVQLKAKDMFDYLSQVEMVLGVFGQSGGADGSVLYEDQRANERIEDLLFDADVPDDMFQVFTMNVNVWDTFYDPGDSVLIAIRDALDAELPGIANGYVDRFGRFAAHGRFARFDPDGVSASAGDAVWDFQRWAAATRGDVGTGAAQIRSFAYNRPRSRIINAAIAWPRYGADGAIFPYSDRAAQVVTDVTSKNLYGYRAMPPMGDLIIKDNFNNDNDGATECQLMAQFYVDNYKAPKVNIARCTFKSLWPDDARADVNWPVMLRADISDIIALTVDEAGIAAEDYFIEGFQKEIRALNPDYDMVTVTPNLTPASYYDDNPFE